MEVKRLKVLELYTHTHTHTHTGDLKKRQNGITLIALVITIIVLLILAGVTIATLSGQNGILSKGGKAKLETEQASILEQIRIEIYEKELDIENKQSEIEYLKAKGIIKEESIGSLGKYASIDSKAKVSSTGTEEGEQGIKYEVNVEKVIRNSKTGKGNLATGDVYYILEGDLYYLTEKKEDKLLGKVFTTVTVDETWFNYIINDKDEIEITGLNFNKIKHKIVTSAEIYNYERAFDLKIERLKIPEQIQGKNVVKIGFDYDKMIGIRTVKGVKEIVYPKTLKELSGSEIIFEDIEKINLPNGLLRIGKYAFWANHKVESITIPASVVEIGARPFCGWNDLAIILVEGKASNEDFNELNPSWNMNEYYSDLFYNTLEVKYLK